MAVSVLSTVERSDEQYEVTLSQDGCRFTMVVSPDVVHAPESRELYQIMADIVCADQSRLREIIKPGGPL